MLRSDRKYDFFWGSYFVIKKNETRFNETRWIRVPTRDTKRNFEGDGGRGEGRIATRKKITNPMNLVGKPVRFCHWSREPIENDGHSFRSRGSTEKKRLETWCWNSQFVKYRNPQRALVTRRVRMTLLSRSKRPKDRFRSKDKSKWRKIAHCCNWRSEEKLIWVKLRRGGALDLNKKKLALKCNWMNRF